MAESERKPFKLEVLMDLMRIVEMGFIHKLKQRRPDITEEEVAEELKRWYMDSTAPGHGDPAFVAGDIKRFL
jgi:hypothetical protein